MHYLFRQLITKYTCISALGIISKHSLLVNNLNFIEFTLQKKVEKDLPCPDNTK